MAQVHKLANHRTPMYFVISTWKSLSKQPQTIHTFRKDGRFKINPNLKPQSQIYRHYEAALTLQLVENVV